MDVNFFSAGLAIIGPVYVIENRMDKYLIAHGGLDELPVCSGGK